MRYYCHNCNWDFCSVVSLFPKAFFFQTWSDGTPLRATLHASRPLPLHIPSGFECLVWELWKISGRSAMHGSSTAAMKYSTLKLTFFQSVASTVCLLEDATSSTCWCCNLKRVLEDKQMYMVNKSWGSTAKLLPSLTASDLCCNSKHYTI